MSRSQEINDNTLQVQENKVVDEVKNEDDKEIDGVNPLKDLLKNAASEFIEDEVKRCADRRVPGLVQAHIIIDNTPTVDAVPVRHGQWIIQYFDDKSRTVKDVSYDESLLEDLMLPWLICSKCRKKALFNGNEDYCPTQYCPHCGAKMDLEE